MEGFPRDSHIVALWVQLYLQVLEIFNQCDQCIAQFEVQLLLNVAPSKCHKNYVCGGIKITEESEKSTVNGQEEL